MYNLYIKTIINSNIITKTYLLTDVVQTSNPQTNKSKRINVQCTILFHFNMYSTTLKGKLINVDLELEDNYTELTLLINVMQQLK